MKMERTKWVVENMRGRNEQSDQMYWRDKTPMERLRAMQINRQVAYGRASTSRGLQRVLEIAERS